MSITLQQPQPWDLVGNELQIAGLAGGAFEATFNYRVSEGHDEISGWFMAGDGAGGHGQFQHVIQLGGHAFKLPRLFVDVFWASPKDGEELDKVSVSVLYGQLILPGYTGYQEHTVVEGDTLWSIAKNYLGEGGLFPLIVAANEPRIKADHIIRPDDVLRIPV